jgi:hypothetical protein
MPDVAAGIRGLLDQSRHKHYPKINCTMCLDVITGIIRAASAGNRSVDTRLSWIKDYLAHNRMCVSSLYLRCPIMIAKCNTCAFRPVEFGCMIPCACQLDACYDCPPVLQQVLQQVLRQVPVEHGVCGLLDGP